MTWFTVEFGVQCDPPSVQLRRQWPPPGKGGARFPLAELQPLDDATRCVGALRQAGWLTDAETIRVRIRIMKTIGDRLRREVGVLATRQVDYLP